MPIAPGKCPHCGSRMLAPASPLSPRASRASLATVSGGFPPDNGHRNPPTRREGRTTAGAEVFITLLGGFQVRLDDAVVQDIESDKGRGLLAFLAQERGLPQRREKLAGLLWPELPERRARHNLSQALYNLRLALGDAGTSPAALFSADHTNIQLNPEGRCQSDSAIFRAGLRGCRQHAPRRDLACDACLALLAEAADRYGGEFLAGYSWPACPDFEVWVLLERERLHRDALAALTDLAAGQRRRARPDRALDHAGRAVALDTLYEPAWRELMHGLWQCGRRIEALAQYQACRGRLEAELGLAPDEATQELFHRIQAG